MDSLLLSLQVVARDRDFGFSGALLYVISDGDVDSVFKIDTQTGDLRIDGYLDRERTSDYMLNITVFDQGVPQKSASRLLHIIVEDCNDNAPQFFKSTFSFFFPENTRKGTPVVTLNATDRDVGLNGKVIYHLDTETEAFSLNPLTGMLVVSEALDREEKEFYDLRIRATDSSLTNPLSSSAMVRVRVLDVNDVPPQFTAKKYTVKVREDLPIGAVVGMVDAFDPDLYQGGKIRFSLEGSLSPSSPTTPVEFSIDEISGTVRVKSKLDYEFKQLYNLTVKARDEGSPSLSSLCTFIIEILDVNENLFPPRFDSLFLRTAIPEDKPIGTHVATVSARDFDAKDSDDSRIAYSIREGDGLGTFFIDNRGNIKTLAVLDRETKSHYWVTIYAQDFGAVPLSSKLYVYIEVLNVNDNIPLTREPLYRPSIPENAKPFSHVVTLEAEDADDDPDSVQTLTYEIITGNPQSLFHMDSNTGIMSTTKRLLDREVQAEHVLEVRISDNGKPALNSTTKVIVTVTDVNDNQPEFLERVYKVQLPETIVHPQSHRLQNDQETSGEDDGLGLNNKDDVLANGREKFERENQQWEEQFGNTTWEAFNEKSFALATHKKPLFRSMALDRDEGDNGRLSFSLKAGPAKGKVQIDSLTGVIYAINDLRAREEYDILVKATDHGASPRSALSRVSIQIQPMAESHSKFAPKIQNTRPAQVFETDEVGHLVALIQAEDQDVGDQLWYSIVEGDKELDFYISPDKGSILLARTLNCARQPFYNLTVSVSDGKFVSFTYVAVKVVEVSEVRPEFEASRIEIDISENAAIGSEVTRLNVSHSARNGKVFFSLHSAQDPMSWNKFHVHPTNGVISIQERLDHERNRRHVLTIAVTDQGTLSPRSNYARVIIHIQDHNDHAPTFLSELIQSKIHETAELGTEVIQVMAIDNDQGDNGRISYAIASGNVGNSFLIDENLGLISVARPLNMLVESEYMLTIRASDHGEVSQSNTVPVHILVTMADDAPPRFERPHYATEVYENQPRGHFIIQVRARSRSSLRYDIIQGNEDSMFVINPSTGIVMTQRELDFEEKRFYNLTIQVSNTVGMKEACTLNVHVLDLNDNAPRFARSSFEGRVSESASTGSLILLESHSPLVIKATDADMGVNSLLFFEIMDETAKRYFAIDESTGAIRTIKNLDFEKKPWYEFYVRVSDRGHPRLASLSLAKVRINVIDENDSPPVFSQKQYTQVLLVPTFQDVSVIRVNASDPDQGIQSNLRYSITGGDENGRFTIDPATGQVLVVKEKEVEASSNYALEISVSEGKYSDQTVVSINVERSDNSGLVFGKSRYFATVLENSTKTDVIVVVTVLGASLNENLRFSLLNPTDLFSIGETSGAIRTVGKAFDRELKDLYELVVEVRSVDQLRALPRVAHVIVEVKVLDINDNPPMFTNQPYHAVMSKETKEDAHILRVSAVDQDTDANGDIYFQLVKGNGELFRVGRKSGQITLRKQLDNYRKDYRLTIAAYDGGSPPFSAEVTVHIKVIDKSVPIFLEQLYKTSVREDVEIFSPFLSVQAESPNEEEGKLIYTLEQGNEEEKFSVDHNSGVISVVEALDFEAKPHYQLTLRATDGVNGGYAEVIILLGVEDVNDCTPKFQSDSYEVKISEALPLGSKVITVFATDADTGQNQEIGYSLQPDRSNSSRYFNIDAKTGDIFLKRAIDHERDSQHSFTVLATDKGPRPLTSSALVKVIVDDANDNAPTFEEPEYMLRLSDRSKRGQFVGLVRAIDLDEIDADKLVYSIIGGNQHQVFSMDERTGVISLVNLHNFDHQSLYSLNVSVSDGVYSNRARVTVSLVSANSFAPVFERPIYETSFPENTPEMMRIYRIAASDADRDDRITYSLASDELSKVFRVDASTGFVWALKSFDREEQDTYELPIVATDSAGMNGFAKLKVTITDQNDNKPKFALSEYKVTIPANFSVGSVVTKIEGWDDEDKANAALPIGRVVAQMRAHSTDLDSVVRYKMASENYQGEDSLFQVDQDGRIIINGHLDRELKSKHGLTILAENDASPTLNSYYDLTIQILDENDNAPKFQSPKYEVSLFEAVEPHTSVIQVQATDLDYGNNGEIRYRFAEKSEHLASLFHIDPNDGWITTQGRVDHEINTSYELAIEAYDNGKPKQTASTLVHLEVRDANDNPTVFSQRHYNAAVNEGALPGTIIFQLQTEDKDSEAKTEIEYFIIQGDLKGQFQIKRNGEMYVSRRLDRETISSYRLEVAITDGTFVSTCRVSIEILDDNDSPPICSKLYSKETLFENVNPGSFVLNIEAQDADQGANAKQIFYLTGDGAESFALDRETGILTTALPMDRENRSTYHLEAHDQDARMPEWECQTHVEIVLLDVNDNAPQWAQPAFSASLREDMPVGTIATKILAVDLDEGDNRKITYELWDAGKKHFKIDPMSGIVSLTKHFKIDPMSGIVSLTKPVDREEQAMFNLTVRAIDQGRPKLFSETSLMVLILDVNDNPPEFASKFYFASVHENVSEGADVVRVLATSRDSGVNADITYSIIGGNEHRKFKIDPKSGVLIVTGDLDHEKSSEYFLTIQAQDGGDPPLSNHATVNITVEDVNDNMPMFSQISYAALINEGASVGETVLTLTANDLDQGENGRISFSIESGDRHNQFRVDEHSGVIIVSSPLDREMVPSYILEVKATDHGEPKPMSNTVLINIDVADANDNPPIFPEGNYTVHVQEDRPIGHVLKLFTVTDSDDEPNGAPFTYDIRAGNHDNSFRVDQDGALKTATKFDHKIKSKYFLQIRVFDNGAPPLFSDSYVTVNIIEESKFPPIVVPFDAMIQSYQDDFPGAVIGKVKASDQDPFDQLQYQLVPTYSLFNLPPQSHLFEIDHNKGTIMALQGLDVGSYSLNISVSDGKFTTYAQARVLVHLISDEMLDNSVLVRFGSVSAEEFVNSYEGTFVKMIKTLMKVRTKDVIILSLQSGLSSSNRAQRSASLPPLEVVEESKDMKKDSEKKLAWRLNANNLEVLFVVKKSKRDYYSREKVRSALEQAKLSSLSEQVGLRLVEIQQDECEPTSCENGSCQDQIVMNDGKLGEDRVVAISTDEASFVAPKFKHQKFCACKQGFAGDQCEIIMNECAREPCPTFQECIPDSSFQGYSCQCPEGLTGALCNVNLTACATSEGKKCRIVNPMTFGGKSYAQYDMLRSIERHLSLGLNLKTLHGTGNIMYAVGLVD
ncbi:hypothetical protein TCAL_04907 [Tigriopus californicus]|uniref:Uncharacterized protein n=1 Tax=Tigriopus californicus TaxID=6832 RepID=A0A553NBE2_TIGCA|nr:hypothetical protein TCAL_04907 [Tigriopus californicus]